MTPHTWTEFLRGSGPPGHAVQVYGDPGELADSVARYLAVGFDLGQPALVVATPSHWEDAAARLAADGWGPDRIARRGLLARADADAVLERILVGGMPSEAAFTKVVGGLLDGLSARFPGMRVRAFGEMVDVLAQRSDFDAAIALEALWNAFARKRSFSLLCGYGLDVFDAELQRTALPEICRGHSHTLTAPDPERLERAVDAALESLLGDEAGKVRALAERSGSRRDVPPAQLALMWVSAQMPRSADAILAAAREHYLRGVN